MRVLLVIVLSLLVVPPSVFSRTLEEIQKSGIIKIGTADIDFKPVHYRDTEGNRVGIDIDVINLVSSKLNLKLDMVLFKGLAKRIELLLEDKVDLVISNFGVTVDRLEKINFSIPYLETGVGLLLHNKYKDKISTFSDLERNPISIALTSGSTAEKTFQEYFANVKLLPYKRSKDAVEAFFSETSDGYSTDKIFLLPTLSDKPNKYYVLDGTLTADTYTVGVNKNNIDLLNQINLIIEEAEHAGELKKIIDRHTVSIDHDTSKLPDDNKKELSHVVLDGESLAKIAYKYYGDYTNWKKIYDANRNIITYPNLINPGMSLKIPPKNIAEHQIPKPVGVNNHMSLDQEYDDKLKYITMLHEKSLISDKVYNNIYEQGEMFAIESQLLKLKAEFEKGLLSNEQYDQKQLSLLRTLFK